MLSKAPHPDLSPSPRLCDRHLCPCSGLKPTHTSEKTGCPLRGAGAGCGLTPASVPLSLDPRVLRPEPRSLSEKVSHLESLLRTLQEDLQKVRGGWACGEMAGATQERGHRSDSASSPLTPGEGRPSGLGGGGPQPAEQQPPAPGLQAPGLARHGPGLSRGAGLRLAAGLLGLPSLRARGHTAPGPLRNSPCARARLSTAPTPQPTPGGRVALPVPVCKYSVRKGLQGLKKPLQLVSFAFDVHDREGVLLSETPAPRTCQKGRPRGPGWAGAH